MLTNEQIANVCLPIFTAYLDKYNELEMIALSTSDGFPVLSRTNSQLVLESDTMAAAASTLFSVSNAISRQILKKEFRVTFIESSSGNVAFIALSHYQQDFVLSMSASEHMNIGQLRVFITRLNNDIIDHLSKTTN